MKTNPFRVVLGLRVRHRILCVQIKKGFIFIGHYRAIDISRIMKNVRTVEEMILESLKEIMDLPFIGSIGSNMNQSKLVFPKGDGIHVSKKRVSEQEARLLFIKQFEKYGNGFYSIEAPTLAKYKFSVQAKGTRSGNIDVCIYGIDGERKHLIEFKALNPDQQSFNKDFDKLMNDAEGLTNFFVHVITNSNKRTFSSIEKKFENANEHAIQKKRNGQSQVITYLCDIGGKNITKYALNVSGTTKVIVFPK